MRKHPARQDPSAPRWLIDLSLSPHKHGFLKADTGFTIQHIHRSDEILYVGFDNLSGPRSKNRFRDPWGYSFAAKSGWSYLGVMAHQTNWYRNSDLFSALEKLAEDGFFARFGKVVFSGTSMGGFAACAFSSLAPNCTVIAFSPQSTLNPHIVEWETRYWSGRKANWNGPYADAPNEVHGAGHVWIVYDPMLEPDRRHAIRFSGTNVSLLKARWTSHHCITYMARTKVLSPFVQECIDGSMTQSRFYELYRHGRHDPTRLTGLVKAVLAHSDEPRKKRLAKALRRGRRPGLARRVEKAVSLSKG